MRTGIVLVVALFLFYLVAASGTHSYADRIGPSSLAASRFSRVALLGSFVRPVAPTTVMRLVLVLRGQRDGDLDNLVLSQANPRSPLYHHWITTTQYARLFGASMQDTQTALNSLRLLGFRSAILARNHRMIFAEASTAVVERTFGSPLDIRFDGRRYFIANRYDPVIPRSLSAVSAVIGLDTFRRIRPSLVGVRDPSAALNFPAASAARGAIRPIPQATVLSGQFAFGPADLYTAYDFQPMFNAGFSGTGQTIAIFVVRQPLQSDLNTFSSQFGLPTATLNKAFLTGACPSPCPQPTTFNDVEESAVDSEWAHASAPNATLDTVSVGDDLVASELIGFEYIVDALGNTVQTVSVSFGSCEPLDEPNVTTTEAAIIEQGVAEGQTWFAASGDLGADGCQKLDGNHATVIVPAAVPHAVAVGGTTMNPPLSLGNVTGYGPEMVWNDSQCASTPVGSGASGGGSSELFAKRSWQVGHTPSDGVRDVPDVALYSDNYITSTNSAPENCSEVAGYWINVENMWGRDGGTSFAAPIWAGLVADIAQKVGHSLGLISPSLYSLENSAAFHQITSGDNTFDGIKGFSAATGYNKATGLGTVDANQLAALLTGSATPTPTPTPFPSPSPHPTATPNAFPTARAIILDDGNGGASPSPNFGDVVVYDATVPTQGALIKTQSNVVNPVDVAYNSVGSMAYILEFGGKIDTLSLPANIFTLNAFSISASHAVALSVKGTNAYVVDQTSRKLFVQPLATPSATPIPTPTPITVERDPVSVIANPTISNVYVANAGSNTLSIIDTSTNTLVQTLSVGAEPAGLGLSPDGKTLLVANRGGGTVSIVNVASSPAVVSATVHVAGEPTSVAVNSIGSIAYVTNVFCPLAASLCSPDGHVRNGTVELLTLTTTPKQVQCCIVVGPTPVSASFDPTGRYLWVINFGGHGFNIIDTQTNTVVLTNSGLLLTPHSSGPFVHAAP